MKTMKVCTHFIAIHQWVAEIFQSGSNWWTSNQPTNHHCLSYSPTANVAKKSLHRYSKVSQSFTRTVATVLALSYTAVLLERAVWKVFLVAWGTVSLKILATGNISFVASRLELIVNEEAWGVGGNPQGRPPAQLTALSIISVSVDAVRGAAGLRPCVRDATQCP